MMNRRIINFLQNLILLCLTASAIYLLTCFPMLDGALAGKMQDLLSRPDETVRSNVDLSETVAMVHLVVTDNDEYGRYARLNAGTKESEFQQLAPLFREAIGSAAGEETVTDEELRVALDSPGIYLDLTAAMPAAAVAAWLGEEYSENRTVKAMALVTTQETAVLYFRGDDDEIVRCESALTSTAVRELTAAFEPNGGQFAFESGYDGLSPYTVLVQETPETVDIRTEVPDSYTAYNLLTALDFNAHTNSRYYESSGVEVILQSPMTLKVSMDGTVRFSTDGGVTSNLYRACQTGSVPTAAEALRCAGGIAKKLAEGTDASALTLERMEKTERGWIITFRYHANGIPVRMAGDRPALRIVIDGDVVTEFTYRCRSYTPLDRSEVLLPPSMAVAIAAMQEGAELILGYVDSGAETLSARWFAR